MATATGNGVAAESAAPRSLRFLHQGHGRAEGVERLVPASASEHEEAFPRSAAGAKVGDYLQAVLP